MAFRFMCDKCHGTFDVAEATVPPKCPFPGARKGRMELQTSPTLEVLATGCQEETGQAQAKDAFLDSAFEIPHFVPETRYGNFTCRYTPRHGRLEIFIYVRINFRRDENAWFSKDWSEKEKLTFKTSSQAAVNRFWNGACQFRCRKVGWTDLPPVTPNYTIVFTEDEHQANYTLSVDKDAEPFRDKNPMMPKCNAGIVPAQIAQNNIEAMTTGFFQSFSIQTIRIPVKAVQPIGLEVNRVTGHLATSMAGQLQFSTGTPQLESTSLNRLIDFAGKLKELPRGHDWSNDYRLPGTPAVPVLITPRAATPELAGQRLKLVQQVLQSYGNAKQPFKVLPAQVAAAVTPAPPTELGATLGVDATFGDTTTILSDAPEYEYNTFAHEFGHMLGLPDEYQNETKGTSFNPKYKLQSSFSKLAHKAGIALPPWGSMTASMMSAGTTMMRQHFLTTWNALGALTFRTLRPTDWEIMLT